MGYNIGPKIGIDGEKEFRQSIKKINDEYKALEAETRAVTAAFDANGDEQGKLEVQSKQLEKQIDKQKEKVKLLEDAVKKATEKYGENSIEATRLRGAMYDAQATVSKLENQLRDTNGQLAASADAMGDLEGATDNAVDKEAKFQSELEKIEATIKVAQSETKALTSAFDANGDAQGKLEAQSKQLEKQIDLQKQKVKLLEDAVNNATEEYGENSIEVLKFKDSMYKAQEGVHKLEKELKDTNSRLDQSEDAMEDFGAAADNAGGKAIDFGDVLKANVISDLIMDGLRELAGLVKEFSVGSVEAAAEMQAVNAQVEQTFGEMQSLAEGALDDISEDTGIAATRMQTAFTKIFAFAKTSGATAENALTISARAMTAAADSAAYYDRSIEDTTETLQAFLKGNFANDAALGIACTETTRNTKANELYAKSFKELSESQKVDVLLAMVEAGNEASGAIGQAARESDSWENVTGELSEVMRQLQVEAGKPALKKLVPIIKKLTDAGYELIEEIDWDEFGEQVEDLIDGVIEHGPGVVKAIASVAAGLVAMKAVKKAEELAGIVQGFFNIGKAAQTTATTMQVTGMAASATPWGAVAAVVGAAAALITSYALQADSDADKLNAAMDSLQEKMADIDADYENETAEIEGAAGAAEYYIGRLKELETAGMNTAAAHEEYKMIVEELNELIPDLNLTIDEQTGLLEQNLDVVTASVEQWKEAALQQALQERYTDTIEAQAKAQGDVIVAQAKYNNLVDRGLDLEKDRVDAWKKVEKANQAVIEAQEEYNRVLRDSPEDIAAAERAMSDANDTLKAATQLYNDAVTVENENKMAQMELAEAIEDAEEVVASYSDEINEAKDAMDLYTESTKQVTAEEMELAQKMEDVQNALDAVDEAYGMAYSTAHESISKQIDLFGALADEADYSAKTVIEHWEKQQKAMLSYSDNLQKAYDMDLSKALIEQLADGSQESMMILEQWVSGTEKDIADINAAYDGLMDGQAVAAETVAELTGGFEDQYDEIYKRAAEVGIIIKDGMIDSFATEVKAAEAVFKEFSENIGAAVVDGVVVGVTKGMPDINQAMNALAVLTNSSFREGVDAHSPARKMIPAGRDVVGGVVVGVEDNHQSLIDSMEKLATVQIDSFTQARLDRAADYPDMVTTGTNVVQNSRVDHNYGGVNIQIYPAEGQDPGAIADAVMDRITTQIQQKEDAW